MSMFSRLFSWLQKDPPAQTASQVPAAATPPSSAPPPTPSVAAGASFPNRAALDAWVASQNQNVGLDFVWLKKDGVGGIGFYTQPDGTITTKQPPAAPPVYVPTTWTVAAVTPPIATITVAAPAVVDLGGAPPTQENLTAYGQKNIAIAGEIPGFVSYGLNMQPPASSVLQAFMTWSAAIAARASNLANVLGFQPGGDAFTSNGKEYSATAIMAKFNALDPWQQAAAISTDTIVMTAVSVSMGRTPAWTAFCSDRMAAGRGIYYMGPGSFNNATGVLTWYDVNGGAQVANVGAFY